ESGLFWFDIEADFQDKRAPIGLILFSDVYGDEESHEYKVDREQSPSNEVAADPAIHRHKNAIRTYAANMKKMLGRENVFALMHVRYSGQDRSFFFSLHVREELDDWIKVIDEAYHKSIETKNEHRQSELRGRPI